MKIASCVPLAGYGVIARYGHLVAVTDGGGEGADPLLSVLAEVAAAAGDGSDLVLRTARAALGGYGQPAWACAGVTADGGMAVLVHGRARAAVRVEDGPEVMLTAHDSVLPVSRKFAGTAVSVYLVIGDPPPPDPQFWLGDGVVPGGGLAVIATADLADPADPANPAEIPVLPPDAPPPEMAEMAEMVMPEAVTPPVPPTILEIDAVRAVDPATVNSADWAAADPASWHPPTTATPATGTRAGEVAGDDEPPSVLVDGVLCPRDHFNDPSARTCRQCGTSLDYSARNRQRRQRPPLGVLVLDDGRRFPLDRDYVLGREPTFDSDVIDGRARPLRINDPNGTVSRLHLRISLTGWRVEVSDLGSANGSVLQSSGAERMLAPFEPTAIEPGARIGIGHRSMQYLAYQGVLP